MTDQKIIEAKDRYFVIKDEYGRNSRHQVTEQLKQHFDDRAKIAIEMVVKWGMVAAKSYGEDSSGRSKMQVLSPEELVNRAMETADALVNAIEEKGWVVNVPHPDELKLDNGDKE